jgi:hypothetical protein
VYCRARPRCNIIATNLKWLLPPPHWVVHGVGAAHSLCFGDTLLFRSGNTILSQHTRPPHSQAIHPDRPLPISLLPPSMRQQLRATHHPELQLAGRRPFVVAVAAVVAGRRSQRSPLDRSSRPRPRPVVAARSGFGDDLADVSQQAAAASASTRQPSSRLSPAVVLAGAAAAIFAAAAGIWLSAHGPRGVGVAAAQAATAARDGLGLAGGALAEVRGSPC